MDPLTLLIAGTAVAALGIGGGLALRSRQKKPPAQPPPSSAASALAPDPLSELPIRIGYMLQVDDAIRWPQSALLVRTGGTPRAAILLSREGGCEQATVCFPLPARELYWLERVEAELPLRAPSRLEIEGRLLDRTMTVPAELVAIADPPIKVDPLLVFSCYEGPRGEAAVALHGTTPHVWYGRRLAPGDYNELGRVDNGDLA